MTLGIIITVAIAAIIIVAMTYIYGIIRGWQKFLEKDGNIKEVGNLYKNIIKEMM